MSGELAPFGLDRILLRYAEKGRIDCSNGSIFICPLDGAPLRFLHKLFDGRANSRSALEFLFGCNLPDDYVEFMTQLNGATLFDNSFWIYGISSINRGLALEDQRPISLAGELDIARIMHGRNAAWWPIGSVAGYNDLYTLELSAEGKVRIAAPDRQTKSVDSFREMICDIAAFLNTLFDDQGFVGKARGEADAQLSKFVSSA